MLQIELGIMRHDINNPQKSQELVDWAMAHGVNHFESCWFYLNGQCEPFLYSLLNKYHRNEYYICGKMPIHNIVQFQNFKDIFATQLERVPGHYFDTYLLQALNETSLYDIYTNEIIPFFLEQKKIGTIRRFGLSIQCIPETFKKYLDLKCWDVAQMPLNYYDWFLCRYDENYQLACEYGLPIIAQAPVKGGLLVKDQIPKDAFEKEQRTLTEAAFDFLSGLDNIEMVLCGNSSLETFQKSYQALETYQKPISMDKFEQVINSHKETLPISCLECARCMQVCPARLPILAYIKLYNLALQDKKYFNAFDIVKHAPDEPNHLCRPGCQECVNICPLHINIPQLFYSKIFELRT